MQAGGALILMHLGTICSDLNKRETVEIITKHNQLLGIIRHLSVAIGIPPKELTARANRDVLHVMRRHGDRVESLYIITTIERVE